MSNLALRYLGNNPRLYTDVGSKRGDKIVLEKCSSGCGLYGPYVNLPRGLYYASLRLAANDPAQGQALIDVCRDGDTKTITSVMFDFGKLSGGSNEIGIEFDLHQAASLCQLRMHCIASVSATIESLEIEFRDVDAASVKAIVRDGLGDDTIFPPLVRLDRLRQLRGFMRRPFAETRRRFEVALVDRLAFRAAGQIAEILAQDPTFRFTKQPATPSKPYQIRLPA